MFRGWAVYFVRVNPKTLGLEEGNQLFPCSRVVGVQYYHARWDGNESCSAFRSLSVLFKSSAIQLCQRPRLTNESKPDTKSGLHKRQDL